ncbi:hypothetical protein GCM10011297_28680 [Bacterioplanes sanyensis]|uniref:hypothetical protein n=1 Tax=Bacterioplanes sanyensis TaxID=1249553 RepID=UPI0016755B61|nr:hypothetical protein [Bacterioplanes sanyensis]GGY54087.1 hypothetical protein GCM10011297_28680 [Bacterioplanes sanyensis]
MLNHRMHSQRLAIVLVLTGLSPCSQADIEEIPAEELTEAYIRDTTIIVPHAQPQSAKQPVNLKVSPAQPGYKAAQTARDSAAIKQGVILPPDMSEQTQQQLLTTLSQQFDNPALNPNLGLSEQYLRNALNLQGGEPINLNELRFPTNLTPNQPLTGGLGYMITPSQLTISIPNSNQYPERSYTTPGGEYQVNVTDQRIEFTLDIGSQTGP